MNLKRNTVQHTHSVNRLARLSQGMAVLTLVLMILMFALNVVCWLWPELGQERFGFSFSISMMMETQIDIQTIPWWQTLGGIVISSLPLLALVFAAINLYHLFSLYAHRVYFSEKAAVHMGRVGSGAMAWVALQFVCTPLMSLWLTINAPSGEHMIMIGFDSGDVTALFLGACFWVIAHILREASEVFNENQSFV